MRWGLALGALAGSALAVVACKKSTTDEPTSAAAECSTTAPTSVACPVLPGEFPPPDCEPTTANAAACGGGGCAIDETRCGSTSTCLPLADNQGRTVLDFRIRRLNIAAPATLAALEFATKVTIPTIELKNSECGEHGSDSWAWLIRLDRANKTLTTGGAPPSPDPFTSGWCFFNSVRSGVTIAPASEIPVRLDANGTVFQSGATAKLTMPLFVGGDPNGLVLLPINDFAVRNVTLSDNDNCIGSYNPSALNAQCAEDPSTCSKWKTGGAMAGYISLEEADGIQVAAFGKTLCAVLTSEAGTKCARDAGGAITSQGDYCAATRSACGCRDSFWVAATFAASAVLINDGSSVPECGSP